MVAWVIALAGLTVALAAQAAGYRRGFVPTTFRATQLGAALIAPLALAWGMAELAAKGLVARFAARLCPGRAVRGGRRDPGHRRAERAGRSASSGRPPGTTSSSSRSGLLGLVAVVGAC